MAKTPGRMTTFREVKTDAGGRAGQFGDDRAGPLIGKIEHHIVALLAERANQPPLHLQLMAGALFFPAPVNAVYVADIRIRCEHIPGFFIKQHIHTGGGILLLKRVNKRRYQ